MLAQLSLQIKPINLASWDNNRLAWAKKKKKPAKRFRYLATQRTQKPTKNG